MARWKWMGKRVKRGQDFLCSSDVLFPCKSSFTCLVKEGLSFLKSDPFFEG